MTFRVVRTNQYNQDLGLIHSTNGNHLESPKEGSSIDHQVTIYLHAQNITMFSTNETWYFASQILVSNSGGLILILTAQSTRNRSLLNAIVNHYTHNEKSQPNPILIIPAGDERISTAGGPEVHMETIFALETHTSDEFTDDGPEGREETAPEQENKLMDESSNQIEKETATHDRDIMVRFGPEPPAQQSMTYTGLGIFDPVEIRMINWATHFLPKIDPAAKGKGVLEAIARPNPVEEHSENSRKSQGNTGFACVSWLPIVAPEALFAEDGANIDIPQITLSEEGQSFFTGTKPAQPARPQILAFEFSTQTEQDQAQGQKTAQPDEQIEEIVRNVENIEQTETKRDHLDSVAGQQTKEQSDPEEENEAQQSTSTSGSNYSGHFSHTGPSLTFSSSLHLGPSPCNLQMVVYTVNSEENTRISFQEDDDYSHSGSHQVFVSSSPAIHNADVKLEEVEKFIASLDSRMMSMDWRMLSMDSNVQSVDSKL
ncbi:hypothetical protein F511_33266 [Dorcoceras hygrometricum]|uniref:Uncharacterized protein n=1 Tax=Dorcoceras hygrometricum TaxID=472368 RepID=A0A2Z7BQ80_9LAMI|nr:hypothetical protein F511_33266 [Dorcoceras hygrometricum]